MALTVISGALVTALSALSYLGWLRGSISEVALLVSWGMSLMAVARGVRGRQHDAQPTPSLAGPATLHRAQGTGHQAF
ncbi:MAG TPA: hypothetical protein VH740_00850 [Vicinamibacterales bacterium]|jgi:hypothetical protein